MVRKIPAAANETSMQVVSSRGNSLAFSYYEYTNPALLTKLRGEVKRNLIIQRESRRDGTVVIQPPRA